jgi:hypothetical protein
MKLADLNQEQRHGDVSGLGDLFEVIRERLNFFFDKHESMAYEEQKIFGNFLAVFTNYVCWAKPSRWMIDHLEEDGSFGILLTGDYVAMVMLRPDGTTTGHS